MLTPPKQLLGEYYLGRLSHNYQALCFLRCLQQPLELVVIIYSLSDSQIIKLETDIRSLTNTTIQGLVNDREAREFIQSRIAAAKSQKLSGDNFSHDLKDF